MPAAMRWLFIAPLATALSMVCVIERAAAGMADVIAVEVKPVTDRGKIGTYRFTVTVRHDDKGWDHYADNFEVLAPDGTILGTRVLAHPHENEQPFTRSLNSVKVPEGLTEVTIRAHDSVHGYGGETVTVTLPDH